TDRETGPPPTSSASREMTPRRSPAPTATPPDDAADADDDDERPGLLAGGQPADHRDEGRDHAAVGATTPIRPVASP
ncbi:MAG TPA: hypothetical protein VGN59_15120, partial [Acidimicrobiia bacterium]